MKLPYSMIRELIETSLSAEQVGDMLTMLGFELEGIEEVEGEPVLEIKVVANRGDGLSSLGLAREILAKDPESKPTELYNRLSSLSVSSSDIGFSITIESDFCSRYAGQIYQNVQNGESPAWLQQRLRQANQRPISLLVDLTNYVMLEMGQPLHAFDLDKLKGSAIVVREARAGEKLTTLNEVEHALRDGDLLICDAERPVALAGIMGGLETEVGASTRNMFLESAHFSSDAIRPTRRALNISTEASYRFERSVDPLGVTRALARFAELYTSITGQNPTSDITEVVRLQPETCTLNLRLDRTRALLGMEVSDVECETYLTKLGFTVSTNATGQTVTAPSWRQDIELEEDLIEEVGRVHGYDKIPALLPEGTIQGGGVFGLYRIIETAKKSMLRCGLDQMWSHSLRSESPLDFNPLRRIEVRNPHSPELRFLRSSLLAGLAEAALKNGGKNVHVFEIGKVFVKGDFEHDESPELAILVTGQLETPHFVQKDVPNADFWTVKGIIEELGHLVQDDVSFALPRLPDHRFHPTRQAGIMVDDGKLWVGTMGQIHPDVALQLGLPEQTFMAEVDLLVFFQNPDRPFTLTPLSRNPSVRRDIAVVFPTSLPYSDIEAKIRERAGSVLEKVTLFDVYTGTGIEPGMQSLGIAMQLRKMNENMNDVEANAVRDAVVAGLAELGGRIR